MASLHQASQASRTSHCQHNRFKPLKREPRLAVASPAPLGTSQPLSTGFGQCFTISHAINNYFLCPSLCAENLFSAEPRALWPKISPTVPPGGVHGPRSWGLQRSRAD
eukprot:scaffold97580_cov46-Prasinocladus_malaysianus.AAC.2